MRATACLLFVTLTSILAAAGCSTAPSSPSGRGTVDPVVNPGAPVTYHDIAPVLAQHCIACHEAGGVAPFPLTTFAEAQPQHAAIAAAVGARTMPPWLPAEGCQTFRDTRRLTDAEIALLAAWSAGGALEGAKLDATSPSAAATARTLAWVDEVVDIGADYVAQPAQGPVDDWRCFLIDPQLLEDKVVVGYDLAPTDRGQVHHAAFVDAPLDSARAKDDSEPGAGWSCPGGVDVPAGSVIGSWAAGYGAVEYPAGTGIPLAKGRGLVVQIHYHIHDTTKPPTPDRTRISLQFARSPVVAASFLSMGVDEINIPPRSKGTVETALLTLPSDTLVRGVVGHMHLLGRSLHVEALDPGGSNASSCLLDIPRWDYRWEEMLFLDGPVRVPAGTTLKLTCTWDNPGDTLVQSGLTPADEMCDLGLVVTPP